MTAEGWVAEQFVHLGAGWSAAINSMDFWICRTCGATVDYQALLLHRRWHGSAPSGEDNGPA